MRSWTLLRELARSGSARFGLRTKPVRNGPLIIQRWAPRLGVTLICVSWRAFAPEGELPSTSRVERRQAGRRAPGLGRLLEGVGEAQQDRLAPGAAGEGRAVGIVRGLLAADPGDKTGG